MLTAGSCPDGRALDACCISARSVAAVVDSGRGDRGLPKGHRDLVQTASHIARGVEAAHSRLVMLIHVQRARGIALSASATANSER